VICQSCREANAILNARRTEEHVREARHAHTDPGRCKGGTWCDCQHLIRYAGVVTARLLPATRQVAALCPAPGRPYS
jgi:hypothetical protein